MQSMTGRGKGVPRQYVTQYTCALFSSERQKAERRFTVLDRRPAGDRERQDAKRLLSALNGLVFSWRDGPLTGKLRPQWFFVSHAEQEPNGGLTHDKFWDPALLHPDHRDAAHAMAKDGDIALRPYTSAAFGVCGTCGMPTRRIGRFESHRDKHAYGCEWELEIGSLCLRCPRFSPLGGEFYQRWRI